MKQRRLPAEWEPQRLVQMTWPDAETDWAPFIDEARVCFRNMAREIALREELVLVARCKAEAEQYLRADAQLAKLMNEAERVEIIEMPINDTWARDHGFITVEEDGKPIGLDFQFNGWGLKFAANHDNLINQRLFVDCLGRKGMGYESHLSTVLEGGSIESDGRGTILTTAECLLSLNRNGADSRTVIEERLKKDFGAERVLWLEHGYLAGDDTDSHIDTLARLAPNDTIVYVSITDETDEHYDELKKMETEIKALRTDGGEPYRLVVLPMASPMYYDGERIPATYANYLYVNGAILLPVYGLPEDDEAIATMQKAFPDTEIVAIDCSVLVRQHGSLHCSAMQFPASVR